MTHQANRILVAALALLVAGCGDDGPTSNVDPTPPRIVEVNPVDLNHFDVVFDQQVTPASAENPSHYVLIESSGTSALASAPGDQLYIAAAVLQADGITISLSTYESMAGLDLTLTVDGVTDSNGSAVRMTRHFVGSDQADNSPPTIVGSTPAANSTDAPIGTFVSIRFSEWIDDDTFREGATWTSAAGPVRSFFDYGSLGNSTFTLYTPDPLEYNTEYTVVISGVQDKSGNTMADVTIVFTTTDVADDTPPTLVSSYPRDGANNVRVDTDIVLTFSEPINRFDFQLEDGPDILFDEWKWSSDGKTFTGSVRDDLPLTDNRQYKILLYPGGVFDLGGRTLDGFHTVTFTTGFSLESGSIEGEVAGHPETAAADPTGAVVIAQSWFFETFGVAVVDGRDDYILEHIDDGPYYVRGYLDTNRDGFIYIDAGDAFGGYGADLAAGDFELESVAVFDPRNLNRIDFSIFDPAAVSGTVTFSGELPRYRPIGIGLFATALDAANLTNPIASTEADWPYGPEWVLNELWSDFEAGDYYLAAYIDADSSGAYDAGTDPVGVYGGEAPVVLHLANGQDYYNIAIAVEIEPGPAARVKWPTRRSIAAGPASLARAMGSHATYRVPSKTNAEK